MALDALDQKIYGCRKCRLWRDAKHAVPGEGPPNAEIMLVGQNPGVQEDEEGRPFVGRTGKFLNEILKENGINREEVFVTNIVKHKTPKNRKPQDDEIEACLPYLTAQIEAIKPKKILLFGVAARKTNRVEGVEYFEIVHPSMAVRFPKARAVFMEQCRIAFQNSLDVDY